MTIEPKNYCMHLTVDSNSTSKLKDCLPATYNMQTVIDMYNNVNINFVENKNNVINYTFKPRFANEEDDKYISIDNVLRGTSQVVMGYSANVNLRYALKTNEKYLFLMKINELAHVANVGDYSNNMYTGYSALGGITGKGICKEENGVYTYHRHELYIGNDIFPVNAVTPVVARKLQLNHYYKLEVTQTSGPACRFGLSIYDERGNEINTITESTSSNNKHVLEFDISSIGKDQENEVIYVNIQSSEDPSTPIVFGNINIMDNLGYFADTPLSIQYWDETNEGKYELTKEEFKPGSTIKFVFTTPSELGVTPGAIRIINRTYISDTSSYDILITPYSDEVMNSDIIFVNHIATNSEPVKFSLMDCEIHKFETLEIEFPATTRYIKINRDTTKNILGLKSVDYIYSSSLIYGREMFKSCWTLTDVTFTGTTSNMIDMSDMFAMCGEMTGIPETLDTSGCLTMDRMFDYCVKLTTVKDDLNTSRCTSMKAMFRGCRELISLPDTFDTTNVTNLREFVAYCQTLDTIPNLNTSNCTNMKRMFLGCKLISILPDLDTSKIESMEQICKDCELLGKIGNWQTSHIKNFNEAFSGCRSLNNTPILNTDSAETMYAMFKGCESLYDFPKFNFKNVRNIREMFNGCTNMVGGYIWRYEMLELIREPYVVQVVEEQKLPEGTEVPKKIVVLNEDGSIKIDDDGKVVYEYELDENGNIQYDEKGDPIYKIELDEEGNQVMTDIVYTVVFKAEYDESIVKTPAELGGCLNSKDWWDYWDETPVYEGDELVEMVKTPHFTDYKDCFKDCDSIANSICIPEEWNAVYDVDNSGEVYVYECVYITTGVTRETRIIHKYHPVETLDDLYNLGNQIKSYFELKNFTTMVTCRELYTYRKPFKLDEMKDEIAI